MKITPIPHSPFRIPHSALPILLTFYFLLFTPSATVFAHAELLAASPAPGAQLAALPSEMRLVFSEPVSAGSTFLLMTADFRAIPLPVYTPPDAPNTLLVDNLPSLAPDIYTVQWLIISSDGHSQTGSYQFGLGDSTMLTSLTLAESAAFNPPALMAWLMIALALGSAAAVRYWLMKK